MRYLASLLILLSLYGCPSGGEAGRELTRQQPALSDKDLVPYDWTYENSIHTVQLYQTGVEETYPILKMARSQTLTLEFDELMSLNTRESDFFVDMVNCDADWRVTNVLPIEFYEGFAEGRIEQFQRSEFTKVPYVHYSYTFPQPGEFFKKSGNYLLRVYRNGNRSDLVLTRRFVVVQSRVSMEPLFLLNDRVERLRLSEFAFRLEPRALEVYNPATELYIKVLQNFRWDNAAVIRQPQRLNEDSYEYYLDLLASFGGGHEFRRLDLRSTRLYGEVVQDIEENEFGYDVFLFPDEVRTSNSFRGLRDRNGSFKVEVQEWPNPDFQADYLEVNFFLERGRQLPEGDAFVFGRFSDWLTRDRFRLTYDETRQRYEGSVLMKQGIYDYAYVAERPGDPLLDEATFEGRHTQPSENFYTVLVYYRAPGDRTDQLVGLKGFNYYD